MSKSQGQRHRPVDDPRHHAAPTRCAGTSSRPARRGRPTRVYDRGHRRVDPPVPAHALEHVLVLRHLREPRRLDARRGAAARRRRTCSTAGSARACTARCATVTDALEGFDTLRGAQALERLRRRPLQLVRAPLPAPVLEGVRPGRPRHAARVPARRSPQLLAPFSPFVADEMYRNLGRPTESVHLADWPAADAGARSTPTLEARDGARPARRVARAGGPQRGQAQGPPAAPPRARAAPPDGAALSTTVARRDRRRAQREAARGGHRPRRPARATRSSPTSAPSGPRLGKHVPLVKDGAGRRRRRRRPARARRATARYELASSTATTVELEPDDVEVRAASHEELALAQDGRLRGRARHHPRRRPPRSRASPASSSGALNDLRKADGLRDRRPDRGGAPRRRRPARRRPTATATGSRARCWRWTSSRGAHRTGRRVHRARRRRPRRPGAARAGLTPGLAVR